MPSEAHAKLGALLPWAASVEKTQAPRTTGLPRGRVHLHFTMGYIV